MVETTAFQEFQDKVASKGRLVPSTAHLEPVTHKVAVLSGRPSSISLFLRHCEKTERNREKIKHWKPGREPEMASREEMKRRNEKKRKKLGKERQVKCTSQVPGIPLTYWLSS